MASLVFGALEGIDFWRVVFILDSVGARKQPTSEPVPCLVVYVQSVHEAVSDLQCIKKR